VQEDVMSAAITARIAVAAVVASVLAACGGNPAPSPSPGPASSSSAAGGTTATETNPAGDIPDSQAFVPFTPSGGGFTVKIPEGWASSTAGSTTTFTDKLNQVQVTSSRTVYRAKNAVSVRELRFCDRFRLRGGIR
jgi:hypothetical protein